ncbi:hypothetical protein TRFO_24232 [Tritrichomonas foetus]|uniref:Uncharacterized protein n=1 Tax=Tritrichomonas foetus TaxID=1144522 RepID=A0A1J4K7X4_9EUKA|nr:hypothetical protein TRFO_24232 [Tritrichomonas foetus]|eukprot:OHT07495.1 hypothetical protein TRFO_24232 [Tritrichomonas foetus]
MEAKNAKDIPWLQEPSASLIDSLVACGLVTPNTRVTNTPKPQSNLKPGINSSIGSNIKSNLNSSLNSNINSNINTNTKAITLDTIGNNKKCTIPKSVVKGGSPTFVSRAGIRASTPNYERQSLLNQKRAKTPKTERKIAPTVPKITTIENFTTPAANQLTSSNESLLASNSADNTNNLNILNGTNTVRSRDTNTTTATTRSNKMPKIDDYIGIERKFAGRKDAQELAYNYHCMLQSVNLDDYSNPESLNDGLKKSLDYTLLTVNKLIMQLRGYSEEHARLLNEIKAFYVRRVEQLPEISHHYTEELKQCAQKLEEAAKNEETLKSEIEIREITITGLHSDVKDAERRYEKLNFLLQETQEKLDSTLLTNASLEDERKSLLFRLSKSEEQKSQAQQTATANQEMLENARAQIQSQEALLEKYQQEGAGFRPLYLKATDEISKLKDQIDDLKDKIEHMVDRKETREIDIQTDPVTIVTSGSSASSSKKKTRNRNQSTKRQNVANLIDLAGHKPLRKSVDQMNLSDSRSPTPKKGSARDGNVTPNVIGSTTFTSKKSHSPSVPPSNITMKNILSNSQGTLPTHLSSPAIDTFSQEDSVQDLSKLNTSNSEDESISKEIKSEQPITLRKDVSASNKTNEPDSYESDSIYNSNNKITPIQQISNSAVSFRPAPYPTSKPPIPPPSAGKSQAKLTRSSSFLNSQSKFEENPLPQDYSIDHTKIETPPTLIGCIYRLLPLTINTTLSNSPALRIESIMAKVKSQTKDFNWVIQRIVGFFHSLYSVDQLTTAEEDTVSLFRKNLLESCSMEVLANKVFTDLVQSCQFYKLTSTCVQFFLQFLMQEFSIVDFKFFNIIFNLCFEYMYPSINSLIEDPELVPEIPQFLIHIEVCKFLLNYVFPHHAGKYDFDELRQNTKITPHPDLVDFFAFATKMISLFRDTHQQFHSQVKNLLTLVGWSQTVDVSEPLFKDFFVLVRPISNKNDIEKLWQRFKLEMSINNVEATINQSSFIHFCSDFPEVSNELLSLPYINNFDRVFSTMPSPLQELLTFLKKRFTKFVRELYLRMPLEIQKIQENTILKIRNSLLRCDVSSTLISYRHFLQLTDLKLTEQNPYIVFQANTTVNDVQMITSMLHSREVLAVGHLGENVKIEVEEEEKPNAEEEEEEEENAEKNADNTDKTNSNKIEG